MSWRSVWAVLAGILSAIVATTLIDVALHAARVFPPLAQPIDDKLALLASSYRIPIGVGSAWLTARLAPSRPMRHALVLGLLGMAAAVAGVVVNWNLGLGPRWYPISLVFLAMPQSWAGGHLFERQVGREKQPS